MPQTHIKAIIWDFGNILARFDHLKACRKLAHYSDLSPENILQVLFSGDDAPAKLHEAGQCTSEEFFFTARKVAHFSEELSLQEFSVIWKDIFQENEGVGTLIDKIRPNVKQCILSNTDPIHWSAIEQLPVMKKYFSDPQFLVRSYASGTRKPDAKIYQDALGCLGLTEKDIKRILYIDDIPEYRNVFERLGGNVLSYDCSKDALIKLEEGLKKFDIFRI